MEYQRVNSDEEDLEERIRGLIITNQHACCVKCAERPESGLLKQQSVSPIDLPGPILGIGPAVLSTHEQISPVVSVMGSHRQPLPLETLPNPSMSDISEVECDNSEVSLRGHGAKIGERSNNYNNNRTPRKWANQSHEQYFRNDALSTASLVHFPPLGTHIHLNPTVSLTHLQRQDSNRGYRREDCLRAPGLYAVKHTAYDHLHIEQALHLDKLASNILEEIVPPQWELNSKKDLLCKLDTICKSVDPKARLIPFGSFVTGFATASSDIDCVFSTGMEDSKLELIHSQSSEIPSQLAGRLREEGFMTNLLSRTRIPIIKLIQKSTEGHPMELHCDIGFKNHLGIYNTQLLSAYSRCDPRVRDMVVFAKWWTKRRRINSPYRGTLSSYGYVLMIIHYLINVVNPPVLPNLQLFPAPNDTKLCALELGSESHYYNVWFYPGALPCSANNSSRGELLRGFFEYYAYKFSWGTSVISIRTCGGLLTKGQKNWVAAVTRPSNDAQTGEVWEVKDRYLLAIEDPFEITHNVGRTCTGNGVGRIRDEFRRSMRFIKARDNGKSLSEGLLEELSEKAFVRKEGLK